jgi:hypothetical protein
MRLAALTALVFALAVGLSQAQVLPAEHARKAPPGLVERAARGEVLQLNIILDNADIARREEERDDKRTFVPERRRAKGLQFNDDQINEQTKRELATLKASVAPQGRIANAQVIDDSPHVPIITMRVPDLRSLQKILGHPKVKAVGDDKRTFVPALSQGYPTAASDLKRT